MLPRNLARVHRWRVPSTVGAVALVAVAVAAWPEGPSSTRAAKSPGVSVTAVPAKAATLESTTSAADSDTRRAVSVSAPPLGDEQPTIPTTDAGPDTEAAPLERVTVLAIGGDGAPLPRVALQACAVADPSSPFEAALSDIGYGASLPSARTNARGVGVIDGLEPGYHQILLHDDFRSTGAPILRVPAEGVQRVVFPCFRWRVRVLDAMGRPAADARVALRWIGRPRRSNGRPDLDGRADDEGRFVVMVPEERRALVRAVSASGTSWSPAAEVDIAPAHEDEFLELVLSSAVADAALALTARCDNAPLTVPFRVGLRDAEVGVWLRALRSEDAGPDGVIRGLLPGRFRLELLERQAKDEFYFASYSNRSYIDVELRAGELATKALPVACHGRVRMQVRAEGLAPAERIEVYMSRAVPEERWLLRLGSDEPSEIGELFRLHLTRRQVLPRSLEPGRRIVTVSAPGFRTRTVELDVRPAEIVDLTVDLEPE